MAIDDDDRVQRRLAAILAADIAGYSRLMGIDEEGTLRQLKSHRRELVDPKIKEHRGRIVKTTGDGMLVEFASVVDAVRCSVEIQRAMTERNVAVPVDRRIEFRIGINVGDIIIDSNDIYGDGVNVAARLEQLAEPGGICVSRVVRDQVRDKLSFNFTDKGEQNVKNIARPIKVHGIQIAESGDAPFGRDSVATSVPRVEAIRPSIAVLPFTNMSGDPDQEYFADGISEDIITALSRLRWLLVVARNSSFVYRGKSVDVRMAARELGVRYVLEGSVRKSGNRLRITAQLIDASTGNHIWADRYDGDLSDIFELQDEITTKVVAVIEPKMLEAEGLRSQARSPSDISAWDLVVSANYRFWRLTRDEVEAAIAVLKDAIRRHPDYAPAHSMLAFFLLFSLYFGAEDIAARIDEAAAHATEALQLDDSDPWAHLARGYHAFTVRRTEEAIDAIQRALDLNPNFAAGHGYLGWALAFDGQVEPAIDHLNQAIRLSPHDPQNAMFNSALAAAHYVAGRYSEAVGFARKAIQLRPGIAGSHRIYCACLAQAGEIEAARAAVATLKVLQPEASLAWVERYVPYRPGPMALVIEGMRKAGLD
ncbi:MAG: adenylate/guanylate cyclase domain-containing protein [Geminicoccaceae bacterium]